MTSTLPAATTNRTTTRPPAGTPAETTTDSTETTQMTAATATAPAPAQETGPAAGAGTAAPRRPRRRAAVERISLALLPRPRATRTDVLLCLGLLTVIMVVQAWNITRFPNLSDDEGTYLAQAWAVQQGDGLAHYTYWYDHPPVGWLQIALLTWIPSLISPDWMTVATMRYAMLPVGAVSAVLVYALALRLRLPRWSAFAAMALFGLSPLSVVLQREIFLDNLAVLWILLAFWLAASPSRHLWHHFGAGLAAAVSVLTKETMLLVLPALLVTMWRHSHPETRKFAVTGAITSCVLVGLLYPLFALLNSELFPGAGHVSLIDGIVYQLSRPGSGSLFEPGTGSHAVVQSWLYYDSVIIYGGLAGAALLVVTHRWSVTARALAGPALAVVILAVVVTRPSGYLPAMYVIQALPFLALVLAAGAASVTHAVLRRRRPGREGIPQRRAVTVARWTAAVALGVAAVAVVAPTWYQGNKTALTEDANASYRAAVAWMGREVAEPADTRVLVDDAVWLDLVHQGYEPGTGVIWFYKADLDPAVTETLPGGYRDIDYVVSSPTVRRDAVDLPIVKDALENSTPVAVFGDGEDRIEIRRIAGGDR